MIGYAREPALRKPRLGSRVNSGHPIGAKCAVAYLLNENGGFYVNDSCSTKYSGTINTSNNYWRSGQNGNPVLGQSSSATPGITFGNSGIVSGTNFTVIAKIFVTSLPSNYGAICTNATPVGLYIYATGPQLNYYQGGDNLLGTTLALNTWYTIALSVKGGTGTAYSVNPNGVLSIGSPMSGITSQTFLYAIGQTANDPMVGMCDWWYFFYAALTPAEIVRVAKNPFGMYSTSRLQATNKPASGARIWQLAAPGENPVAAGEIWEVALNQ